MPDIRNLCEEYMEKKAFWTHAVFPTLGATTANPGQSAAGALYGESQNLGTQIGSGVGFLLGQLARMGRLGLAAKHRGATGGFRNIMQDAMKDQTMMKMIANPEVAIGTTLGTIGGYQTVKHMYGQEFLNKVFNDEYLSRQLNPTQWAKAFGI